MPSFLDTTSLQVFLKPAAMCEATLWARCEAKTARTRALKASMPMGGRLRRRSSRSRWRRRLHSHAPNFSTGFRSGDDAGTGQSVMFSAAMACLLAAVCRKASLSHKIFQGPCRCTGCSAVMAAWSFPVWTTRHHSSAV